MSDLRNDPLYNVFAADEANNTENVKTAFPEYPGEKPKKNELILWVEH